MEIATKYDPSQVEDKWYKYWMDHKLFRSVPDEREPYCIVIPPPNVTGVLHMGHMLNNTIQDIFIRRAHMLGKNALWVPGTDHASIATEARVVAKLKSEGISKKDIGREKFLEHAWEWTHKHGGIILEQLKKLGASCDWDRTRFTMDEMLSESVLLVFIDLFEKGLIYRGVRMVNWDPRALTAVSDEEVNYKEVNSKLYYVRYRIEGTTDEWITIATTRPETILGDTAICVHPEDERYASFKGKRALVPLINRSIPIIYDEYVERDFGTGALKVTPAHDINDYNLGIKHKLPSIDIFNDNGTLNEKAEMLIGEDRFVAREKMVTMLVEEKQLTKIEDIVNKVGYSERTNEVIEPRLSMQWFMKMTEMAKPALEVVMNDTVKFHPAKFKNTYNHWMENVKDWCISRQLWWGHRIPAFYLPNGEIVAALNTEDALKKAKEKFGLELKPEELRQDEDVLDTWFSSWLWPVSVFDGIRKPDNEDIKYYYPTSDLITAPDILFFWVARMIMAGLEYRKDIPFHNVYLTGMVRDKLGRKMSKSLGNSQDPIELMEKYSSDGVRTGMLFCSPAGNDLPFDEALCEQGRNFCNKIWNAFRLIKGWTVDETLVQPDSSVIATAWFHARLNEEIAIINDHFSKYRVSDALMSVYKLVWDDFCSWFLEMIKPAYQQPIDRKTLDAALAIFDKLLKMMHPFMPFITEELWHLIQERNDGESILKTRLPEVEKFDTDITTKFDIVKEVIMGIRNVRGKKNIPNKESVRLFIKKNNNEEPDLTFDGLICKLCNIEKLEYVTEKVDGAFTFVVRNTEFYLPLSSNFDVEEEIKKLTEELNYTKGFLQSVQRKLGNEKFVNNAAAAIVDAERKKQADAEARIKVLEEQIEGLKK